jgi:hypothetical protein
MTLRQEAMNWFASCGYSFLETALMIGAQDRRLHIFLDK